jgi:hypothetical protein
MEAALHAARALMPEDASEADEGKVIDVLAHLEELRGKLREAGLEPPGGQLIGRAAAHHERRHVSSVFLIAQHTHLDPPRGDGTPGYRV